MTVNENGQGIFPFVNRLISKGKVGQLGRGWGGEEGILLNLTAQLVFLFIISRGMLSNISVNLLTPSRPGSAHLPARLFGAHAQLVSPQVSESAMGGEKVMIPVKEYSNKFLREHKPSGQLVYNHSILRPKKSLIYVRKEMKNRNCRYTRRAVVNKENESCGRALKTEASHVSNVNKSQTFAHSVCGVCDEEDQRSSQSRTPVWKCSTSSNKMERISTSRALEMFSKVFKNENIERMKIRKQVHHNTSDVQVKQVALQDKEERKKVTVGLARRPNLHPTSTLHGRKKRTPLFQDDNFELVGW